MPIVPNANRFITFSSPRGGTTCYSPGRSALSLLGILPRAGHVTSGTAHFEGVDLLQLKDRQLRKIRGREIAMIFQDPMTSLNPVLTIGRQIREALETHFGMNRKEAKARAAELLDQVGGNGVALAVQFYVDPAPALLVLSGKDDKQVEKAYALALRIAA